MCRHEARGPHRTEKQESRGKGVSIRGTRYGCIDMRHEARGVSMRGARVDMRQTQEYRHETQDRGPREPQDREHTEVCRREEQGHERSKGTVRVDTRHEAQGTRVGTRGCVDERYMRGTGGHETEARERQGTESRDRGSACVDMRYKTGVQSTGVSMRGAVRVPT